MPDLVAARSQMALSLGWHIVLACYGVGFPLIVLLAEWRALRTGDDVYMALARAWTKSLGVLFAIGAVSGTILSFELGILWPRFMGRFGEVDEKYDDQQKREHIPLPRDQPVLDDGQRWEIR